MVRAARCRFGELYSYDVAPEGKRASVVLPRRNGATETCDQPDVPRQLLRRIEASGPFNRKLSGNS
jgi:hypothetical protein